MNITRNIIVFFLKELGLNKNLIKKIQIVNAGFSDAYILNKKELYEIGLPSGAGISFFIKLYALAHEISHVKQYEKKELIDLPNGKSLWRGKVCEIETEKNYASQPYEIDANKKADFLIEKFQIKYGKINLP